MLINPKIKNTLSEISRQSVQLHNDPTQRTRYLRRMLKVYENNLSEEERIYLLHTLLEMVHYRNLSVDPDNMLVINNIRLRTLFFVFITTLILMFAGATLFKSSNGITIFGSVFLKFMKMFTL